MSKLKWENLPNGNFVSYLDKYHSFRIEPVNGGYYCWYNGCLLMNPVTLNATINSAKARCEAVLTEDIGMNVTMKVLFNWTLRGGGRAWTLEYSPDALSGIYLRLRRNMPESIRLAVRVVSVESLITANDPDLIILNATKSAIEEMEAE